jgi:hypothetical protein
MEVNGQLHAVAALSLGREPGIHLIGGYVGPGADLEKVNIPCLGGESNYGTWVFQHLAYHRYPVSASLEGDWH